VRHEADNKLVVTVGGECHIEFNTSKWRSLLTLEFYGMWEYALRYKGTTVAQWLRCCTTNRKVAVSIPAGVSGFFIDTKFFRSHYGPGVDSGSNRNKYQEHFLGVKSGRCARLTTLPPSCAVVTKSANLNFLEPSGPVQACNGTDFPLPLQRCRTARPCLSCCCVLIWGVPIRAQDFIL